MPNLTQNEFNLEQQVKDWLKQEHNGVQFPVDFDDAWKIAGYAQKHHGKRKLTAKTSPLIEGEDYLTQSGEWTVGGRSSDSIFLTCDAFKHFCLMAKTEQGRQIRQYFIEAEKNWKLVQQQQPELAQDIELQKLKLQSEVLDKQLELRKLDNSMTIMHGKEYVLTLRGHDDQIVEIEKPTLEVIDQQHNVSFKGQTLKQVAEYVKRKFGAKFKSGAELKRYLEKHNLEHLIGQTKRSVLSDYIPEENLNEVYRFLGSSRQQKLLGE